MNYCLLLVIQNRKVGITENNKKNDGDSESTTSRKYKCSVSMEVCARVGTLQNHIYKTKIIPYDQDKKCIMYTSINHIKQVKLRYWVELKKLFQFLSRKSEINMSEGHLLLYKFNLFPNSRFFLLLQIFNFFCYSRNIHFWSLTFRIFNKVDIKIYFMSHSVPHTNYVNRDIKK